jgi:predicted GIY-YIG superfamily endonuclease
VASAKNRRPFRLIYFEACLNEQDATAREKYLKTGMKALSKKQTKAVPIFNGVNVA